MKRKTIIITSIVVIILLLIFLASLRTIMSHVEHPKYSILEKHNNIEIRQYQPMLIAEVSVTGDRRDAIKKGFRILANFIFGDNISQHKIAMTAPVTQQSSSKIAMTAPVTQFRSGKNWNVQFTMPAQYNLENLPKPKNDKIKLIELPAKKYITIQFSGRGTPENLQKHQQILQAYIQKHKIRIMGEPIYAFYNPPWTLPFLRRNEIMWELQ